jgi:hypothetical protein
VTGDRPRRDLVLPVHLALVALLGLATIVLLATPAGNGDCCLPIAVLGLFTLAELVAVLVGIAIAGFSGRHSPLALIDAAITAPLMALVPSAFGSPGGASSSIVLLAMLLLGVGMVSAVLAARVVREHGVERIVLAAGLALLAAFSFAVPVTTVVPIVVLAAVLFPHIGMADVGFQDVRGGGPRDWNPDAPRASGRRRAPDAAAILAQRRPDAGRAVAGQVKGDPQVAPNAGPPPDPPDSG